MCNNALAQQGACIVLRCSQTAQVVGATRERIDSEAAALRLITQAARARSTDATNMNAASSRSHSVFTLYISGRHEEGGVELLGSLNLVDLAGCERLQRSGAEGARQKETCAINKSLSSLGDIFQVCSMALLCGSQCQVAMLFKCMRLFAGCQLCQLT